jgi:hypothetical protein
MIWNISQCLVCLSHNNKNVYGIHSLFINIRNGGRDVIGGQNPIFESIDGSKVIRVKISQDMLWITKYD